jgi:hypothetical protein
MAHDVFISYSSKDKTVADAVCATLERKKIRCWIAPRDVPAGQPYAASLVRAIKASSVVILILSQGSNQSIHVLREMGEAVDNGIPILPLRIEDVNPTDEMHYYIKSIHWLDAMNPPLERHLEKLADSVQALLSVREPPSLTEEKTAFEAPAKKRRKIPVWGMILLILVGFGFFGSLGISALKRQNNDAQGRTLAFTIPNEYLWHQEKNSYTIVQKPPQDTFAWSDEIIKGDFILSAEVTSEQPDGVANFIIYGDGSRFSKGCLIFTFGNGYAIITKDTLYHQGENFLVVNEGDFTFREATHNFTIEINANSASFYVDGMNVAFAFLLPEINRQGKVGLFLNWEAPVGVTYSNFLIKMLSEGD